MKKGTQITTKVSTTAEGVDSALVQLSSRDLFRQANTVRIEHNGEHYWLRLTRGNKLILTK